MLADIEALIDADTLSRMLVLTDSDALIDADTLLLKLVLADTEALIDADWLALAEIDAEFWLLDAEAEALWLALTDALAD